MIISDNETKVDMLNNRAIAKTIVGLLSETPSRPISIGVHGDWGAGKSSILEMIQEELSDSKDILCLKFNGWQFQGFEDAKIALIEGIVSSLIEKRSLKTKATDLVKKIWNNINWLKVAKGAGSLAVSLFTGVPPMSLIQDGLSVMNGMIKDPQKTADTIEKFGGYIKDSLQDDKSITKEILEFRELFDELIKKAEIKQLVVLIDDLDRCLPKVAVETLEAIRLFMFTKNTAFIIAADETMIEYSVRDHFPDLPESSLAREFARKYLEKLIQVPFRIPTLGLFEAKIYISLLMICSDFEEENPIVNKIIEFALTKVKRPWENNDLTTEEIKEIIGDDQFIKVQEKVIIANQICDILASGSSGNPRQIKRFINTLLLRYQIAKDRGFGDDIKLSILAKLMLVERFMPEIYAQIAYLTAGGDGKCNALSSFESSIDKDEKAEEAKIETKEQKMPEEWKTDTYFIHWARIEPKIGNVDLRPYYFANKEKTDYFSDSSQSGALLNTARRLTGNKMYVAGMKKDLHNITSSDAVTLFKMVTHHIQSIGEYQAKPDGIEGLRILVESHPELQGMLLVFLRSIPIDKIGPWVCSGWDSCIIDRNKERLEEFLEELKSKGNKSVQAILKSIKK